MKIQHVTRGRCSAEWLTEGPCQYHAIWLNQVTFREISLEKLRYECF